MRVDLTLPKGWGELKSDDLKELSRLFLRYSEKADFLSRCFFHFSGWRVVRWKMWHEGSDRYYYFKKKGQKQFCITAELFHTLVKKLDWITKEIQLPAAMPEIGKYNSCSVKLFSVSLDEYLNADNYFQAYSHTKETKYLDKLIAIFYTKSGETWDGKKINKRSRRFRRQPTYVKYAVYLWFTGVKVMLKEKYPFVFTGKSSRSGNAEEMILNLLSSLNNGDVTNNETIFRTHVHECFHELNIKLQQLKKK